MQLVGLRVHRGDGHRPAAQARVELLLDGREVRVHIDEEVFHGHGRPRRVSQPNIARGGVCKPDFSRSQAASLRAEAATSWQLVATGAAGRIGLHRPAEPPCACLLLLLLAPRLGRGRRPAGHPRRRLRGRHLRRLEDHRHRVRQGAGHGHAARTRCPSPATSARGWSTASAAATQPPARSPRRSSRSSASTSTSSSAAASTRARRASTCSSAARSSAPPPARTTSPAAASTSTGTPGTSTEFEGKKAVIQIVDEETGGWGHINVDHIVQSDREEGRPSRLQPRTRDREALPAPAGEDRRRRSGG